MKGLFLGKTCCRDLGPEVTDYAATRELMAWFFKATEIEKLIRMLSAASDGAHSCWRAYTRRAASVAVGVWSMGQLNTCSKLKA